MDKKILTQLVSLEDEERELLASISRIEGEITRISKIINRIEHGEMVKDKVYGGEGGIQGFVIEGVPAAEYTRRKSELLSKKMLLERRKELLAERQKMVSEQKVLATEFINGIEDSWIRRIVEMRCIDQLTWNEIAVNLGIDEHYDSIRMTFNRFLEKT